MKKYYVIIPIAGHVTVEVEANNKEEAKVKGFEAIDHDNYDISWECLESFNTGNYCHCPSPWEIETDEIE